MPNRFFCYLIYNEKARALGNRMLKKKKFEDSVLMPLVQKLNYNPAFLDRGVNQDFSGGEKKRNEILQMALLDPDLVILDEIDSGLDVDALKGVTRYINDLRAERRAAGRPMTFLIITHYNALLKQIQPDFVHIMLDGKFVDRGGPELIDILEKE